MKDIQKTCIYHNPYNVINTIIAFVDKTKVGCIDYTRPSVAVDITALKKASIDAKEKGVKLGYGTEITCDNVSYCKELINTINVGELRHIDGIKDNFYVTARDRGAGIDFQLLNRLFSKFVTKSKEEAEGTGLGLSISKSIVEAHDENILDRKGATFSYTLPNAELGGKLQ
jgi:signal transduction histidine kinase